jgi:hypothetical protein
VDAFTGFCVVSFPRPWPLATRTTLLRQSLEGRNIYLIAHTDGHLEVATGREGYGIETRSHFQQISISGPHKGIAIVTFTYGEDKLSLYINRTNLRLLSKANGQVFDVQVQEHTPSPYSLDDPGAKSACQKWVDSRYERFAKKKVPALKKASRSKSLEEQLEELEDAVEALTNLAKDIQAGNKHLAPALAAQLRALIYWPNDKPTWNPLLYRLANGKSLPLPVYNFAVDRNEPRIIKEATYHVRNLTPSVMRRQPSEVVMDLQEYMTSTVQTVRSDKGESRISIEETLGAAANSLGAAHYDETIALDVDLLRMHVYVNSSLLHRILIGLAEAVVVLSRHVLQAYH